MLTLTRLRQVVSLAEHGSFHRAAATLQLSQPALTKSIQVLEAALGVRLFDRQQAGVALTEFGKLVVEYTREIVATENELLRRIGLLANLETGSVRIALGPYPSVMAGYPAIGRLMAAHSKLKVSLQVANWREVTRLVAEQKVDVGIAELSDAAQDDTLHTEPLAQYLGRFFCRPGHPVLHHHRIGLTELLRYPWATNRVPQRLAAAFPQPLGAAGHIDPFNGDFVPAIELDVPMHLASLVKNSDVIAFGSFTMAERDLEAGILVVIPTPDLKFRSSYGFILHKNRALSPATQAFMKGFREEEKLIGERERRLERMYRKGKRSRLT